MVRLEREQSPHRQADVHKRELRDYLTMLWQAAA